MTEHADYNEIIPGTRRLYDVNGKELPGDADLKKSGNIVLIPQPTESPNDPLRWGLARKILSSSLVLFVTALTAATSNDAGAAQYNQNLELGISYDAFNTGAGVLFIGIGYWTLLSSPAVHLYGRRILYLVGMLLGLGGSIWFGRTQNVNDAIWSQLFVGASESVAEAAVQLSLMDLWFQHQIGAVLGVYVLATGVGTYLGPLVATYIADSSVLGWRWVGYMGAVFSGFTFLLFFFGLEETAFPRDRYLIDRGERYLVDGVQVANPPPDTTNNNVVGGSSASDEEDKAIQEKLASEGDPSRAAPHNHANVEARQRYNSVTAVYDKPIPYWRRIAVITPAPNLKGLGFKQYIQRLFLTIRVFTIPAVWYAGIQWGMQNAALTFYLTVENNDWFNPPYNYTDAQDANMNIPCVIGAVIGCLYGGWFSDKFLIWMTKRNGGVMEAEMRLWLMYLCAIIFPTGMWIFGIGTTYGWRWPAPYVGLGFIGFGYGCAGDLSMAYLVDAYPEMVLEGMVGVAVINNTIGCIFSFVASIWLGGQGTRGAFAILGALCFLALMLTVPMMVFGKRARRWTRDYYRKFLEIRDGFDS